MSISRLIDEAAEQLRNSRAIVYILEKPAFRVLFSKFTVAKKELLFQFVADNDARGLKAWLKVQTPYKDNSVRDLRKISGLMQIPDYYYMRKEELLDAIRERTHRDLALDDDGILDEDQTTKRPVGESVQVCSVGSPGGS